jgi:methylated-DNA-[protein]-cysteine S-methyltransferase
LVRIAFGGDARRRINRGWRYDPTLDCDATRQLREYFGGERREFDLPLVMEGTPFQIAVWRELAIIPYGETTTYGRLAASVGRPDAPRAVGAACGANPLPIVVPCHRVVGRDGKLVGFGGGIAMKRALLAFEGARAELFAAPARSLRRPEASLK